MKRKGHEPRNLVDRSLGTVFRWQFVGPLMRFAINNSSLVAQDGKLLMPTRFSHCVLAPSSSKRIAPLACRGLPSSLGPEVRRHGDPGAAL